MTRSLGSLYGMTTTNEPSSTEFHGLEMRKPI